MSPRLEGQGGAFTISISFTIYYYSPGAFSIPFYHKACGMFLGLSLLPCIKVNKHPRGQGSVKMEGNSSIK